MRPPTSLALLLAAACLFSCGRSSKTRDEYIAAEMAQLKESLQSNRVMEYRLAKLIVRAAGDSSVTRRRDLGNRFGPVMHRFMDAVDSTKPRPTASDYLDLYRDYRALRKLVYESDEDDFPLLIETLAKIYGDSASTAPLGSAARMRLQAAEHGVLSVLAIRVPGMGSDVSLYECSRADMRQLPRNDVRALLQFWRGVIYFREELNYLAEDPVTDNIQWLERDTAASLDLVGAAFGWTHADKEQTRSAFLGINYLLRSAARRHMQRDEDKTMADGDARRFGSCMSKAGLGGAWAQAASEAASGSYTRATQLVLAETLRQMAINSARYSSRLGHNGQELQTWVSSGSKWMRELQYYAGGEAVKDGARAAKQGVYDGAKSVKKGVADGAAAAKEETGKLWDKARKSVKELP